MYRKIVPLVSLLIIAIPTASIATLWNYTAQGSVVDTGGVTRDIAGSMVISDLFVDWGTGQPLNSLPGDSNQGQFQITEYWLDVAGYDYSGSLGSLYLETSSGHVGDTQWILPNASRPWNPWIGFFVFCDTDQNPYANDSFLYTNNLAPLIKLVGGYRLYNDPLLGTGDPTFDLWLQRTAQVPEPSTMLLMGSGLLGLIGLNRWKPRRRRDARLQ